MIVSQVMTYASPRLRVIRGTPEVLEAVTKAAR